MGNDHDLGSTEETETKYWLAGHDLVPTDFSSLCTATESLCQLFISSVSPLKLCVCVCGCKCGVVLTKIDYPLLSNPGYFFLAAAQPCNPPMQTAAPRRSRSTVELFEWCSGVLVSHPCSFQAASSSPARFTPVLHAP